MRINLEVTFVTFHDDELMGTNVLDYKNPNSFILTTGGYPHEILFTTRASSAKFSKLTLTLDEVKDIVVEKKVIDGNNFEVIAERTLPRGEGGSTKQVQVFDLDPEGAGKDIRNLKLRILSGYNEFAGIYSVEALGEESLQQIAVLESKAEVNL